MDRIEIKQKGKKEGRREGMERRRESCASGATKPGGGRNNHGKHIGMDPSPQPLINTDLKTTHKCNFDFGKSLLAKRLKGLGHLF